VSGARPKLLMTLFSPLICLSGLSCDGEPEGPSAGAGLSAASQGPLSGVSLNAGQLGAPVAGGGADASLPNAGSAAAGESVSESAGESAGELAVGGVGGGGAGAGQPGGAEVISCDEGVACGVSCVDTNSDPSNCGGCGRTCVIPNATAGCVAAQCVIERCDLNHVDRDGQLSNGCELESSCVEGGACLSECGSEGLSSCLGDEERCLPPEERCNLIDDDCDGSCDEGWEALGCRSPVHRGYGNGYHIYSTNLEQVRQNGAVEAERFFYLSSLELPNSRPVFFCRDANNRPFLSNLTDCGVPRAPEATLGFWLAASSCGAQPLYHLLGGNGGDYFYTTSATERDYALSLGFQDRGVAGYIWLP